MSARRRSLTACIIVFAMMFAVLTPTLERLTGSQTAPAQMLAEICTPGGTITVALDGGGSHPDAGEGHPLCPWCSSGGHCSVTLAASQGWPLKATPATARLSAPADSAPSSPHHLAGHAPRAPPFLS